MCKQIALLPLVAIAIAAPAHAGEDPLYEPVPDWVAYSELPAELSGPPIILFDEQRRIENGRLWSYSDRAIRVDNPQMLQNIGTIQANWLPDKGDLIVHAIEILREGETIDVLAEGAQFDVLRRERQLEQRMLNGAHTATLAVPGLRVGDVLRIAYSVTLSDQALEEEVQAFAPLPAEPFEARMARVIMSWPQDADVRWQATQDVEIGEPTLRDGFHYLEVDLPLAERPEMPGDAPVRYQLPPVLQAATFADWREVSARMAPLYGTDGAITPGGEIAGLVEEIEGAHASELGRAVAALRLVQDEIAYLLNGMQGGNYIPQTPAETWTNRFGDCKAKSMLLLAMLREMDIESEAVVVSAQAGDAVPFMLPAPGAFDHMVVRAVIDGTEYWLDGTTSGASMEVVAEVPAFHHALPLREGGADLMEVAQRPQSNFDQQATITLDFSAGLDLPTPFEAEWILTGPAVAPFSGMIGQVSDEQMEEFLGQFVAVNFGPTRVVFPEVTYDGEANVARITATGLARRSWSWDGALGTRNFSLPSSNFSFSPDRSRAAWRDIPVATPGPWALQTDLTVMLPQESSAFALEGKQSFETELANARLKRDARLDGNRLHIVDSAAYLPGELDTDAVREQRFNVARFGTTALTLRAPSDVARRTQYAGRADDPRLAAIEDAFAADIARDTEDAQNYADRGNFRWLIFDWAGAEEDYTRAIELDSTTELFNDRGYARLRLGRTGGAVEDFMESYILDPTPSRALALANAQIIDRRFEDARSLLGDLDGDRGVHRTAEMYLADIDAQEGNAQAGLDRLLALLNEDPGDPSLLNSVCWHMAAWELSPGEMANACTRAVENAESPAVALDSRALAYLRQDRIGEALSDIEQALALNPLQNESLLLRGLILEAQEQGSGMGDIEAALALDASLAVQYGKYGFALPR